LANCRSNSARSAAKRGSPTQPGGRVGGYCLRLDGCPPRNWREQRSCFWAAVKAFIGCFFIACAIARQKGMTKGLLELPSRFVSMTTTVQRNAMSLPQRRRPPLVHDFDGNQPTPPTLFRPLSASRPVRLVEVPARSRCPWTSSDGPSVVAQSGDHHQRYPSSWPARAEHQPHPAQHPVAIGVVEIM